MNEVVRLNNTRIRILVIEQGKPDMKIPKKYLTKEWIRITDAEKFEKIFGYHVSLASRYIENWFVAIHVTDPYFREDKDFKAMKEEFFQEFQEEFKTLAFNKGLSKAELDKLSVFEIALLLKDNFNIDLKINPMEATYTTEKRHILSEGEYKDYFVDQLKEECAFFGLKVGGTKAQLIARLLAHK